MLNNNKKKNNKKNLCLYRYFFYLYYFFIIFYNTTKKKKEKKKRKKIYFILYVQKRNINDSIGSNKIVFLIDINFQQFISDDDKCILLKYSFIKNEIFQKNCT